MTIIWSFFWIVTVGMLQHPADVAFHQLALVSLVFLTMVPIQIWVYNAYFVMVKQHREGAFRLLPAFREGLWKLPHGMVAFALIVAVATTLSIPGIMTVIYGTIMQMQMVQLLGALLILGAVLGVLMLSFFAPASVVIGEHSFVQNLKDGVLAAHKERHEVILLTVLSFALLLSTQVVHSGLEFLGILGFFAGRIVAAVISVYFLLVNPELFLHATADDTADDTGDTDADDDPDAAGDADTSEEKEE